LFGGVRAPSTLGTFLRAFRFGHVRQLDAVAARFTAGLARHAPLIATDAAITYLDIDDTVRATFGYAKQGAGYGYSGVKGLNALLAIVSTPSSAPVIVATRLRKGAANSARGAARLVADAIKTSRGAGAVGTMVLRADSAYYGSEVIAAARRHGARFSITARKDRAITAAIAGIGEDAWTAIHYPRAVFDEQLQQWVSDAEVAEVPFTAFTSKPKARQVSARLIVRRVRDQNPDHVARNAQGELFQVWRHHAVFTDSPLPMLEAERDHRRHAIVEQVIADLKHSALAHLPSGHFAANSAWLVLAAMAFNLTRAAGTLASTFHAKAATATIRRQLISVAARVTRSARRSTLRLPTAWPWAKAWQQLFTATTGPPTRA
jgi:Transposase DDE domain group 1